MPTLKAVTASSKIIRRRIYRTAHALVVQTLYTPDKCRFQVQAVQNNRCSSAMSIPWAVLLSRASISFGGTACVCHHRTGIRWHQRNACLEFVNRHHLVAPAVIRPPIFIIFDLPVLIRAKRKARHRFRAAAQHSELFHRRNIPANDFRQFIRIRAANPVGWSAFIN